MTELRRNGFDSAQYVPEKHVVIPSPDHPGLVMSDTGVWLQKGNELTPAISNLANKLNTILDVVSEMTFMWDNTQSMRMTGMTDYHKFSEYKDVLLTAREDADNG